MAWPRREGSTAGTHGPRRPLQLRPFARHSVEVLGPRRLRGPGGWAWWDGARPRLASQVPRRGGEAGRGPERTEAPSPRFAFPEGPAGAPRSSCALPPARVPSSAARHERPRPRTAQSPPTTRCAGSGAGRRLPRSRDNAARRELSGRRGKRRERRLRTLPQRWRRRAVRGWRPGAKGCGGVSLPAGGPGPAPGPWRRQWLAWPWQG